jgi:phage tail-like protein
MNVNDSRYHLFLGSEDWAKCSIVRNKRMRPLSAQWRLAAPPEDVPAWDKITHQLTLAQLDKTVPDTPTENAFTAKDRRGVAADRYGNIYGVAEDQRSILVESRGSDKTSAFWPAGSAIRQPSANDFSDAEPAPTTERTLTCLTVTGEDFLVAGYLGGFLRFDLVGGGAPEFIAFPSELAGVTPTDIAPAPCGGLWMLDDANLKLYRINRDLGFAMTATSTQAAFQPSDGPANRPEVHKAITPIALTPGTMPVALASLPTGHALILSKNRLEIAGPEDQVPELLASFAYTAYCMAITAADDDHVVMIADTGGNQVHAFGLEKQGNTFRAVLNPDVIPMRRFGGRGLVNKSGKICYDSGITNPLWVPVMVQKRQYFARENIFITPVKDSAEPQCVWDRIRIDGCIPTGTSVTIEARASDDMALVGSAADIGWITQPQPYLNRDGGELPGKREIAIISTDPSVGRGCWDVLLQNVTGRYLELRITMRGDSRFTPHLRAMRIWYPRFSYPARFLPGVYREEPQAASFIERFLANMEGINTAVEGRIAAVQSLFDTRTAPAATLDWLASWYDMALDPRWEGRRKRLFIKYAPKFFGWRGTIKGLKLALQIATDPEIDEAAFQLDGPIPDTPKSIRIVENYMARPRIRALGSSAAIPGLPAQDVTASTWSPAEGALGLARRWEQALHPESSTLATLSNRFDLATSAHTDGDWSGFCQTHFGFVPKLGPDERARWQSYQRAQGITPPPLELPRGAPPAGAEAAWAHFTSLTSRDRSLWQRHLQERHRQIERLNSAWGEDWPDFAQVPLPDFVPANEAAIRDWLIFEGQVLPMDRTAHRFSVLLPRIDTAQSAEKEADLLAISRRIIEIEKPAHTLFDVRFYWAMNRIGEARLSLDTQIGESSRAPELVPAAIVGRAWLGASFVGGPDDPGKGRSRIAC